MIKFRPMAILSLIVLLTSPCATRAGVMPDPAGEWLVHDKTAHMRMLVCGSKLWSIISWIKTPDTDRNNPTPSKRNRPLLGLPIVLGMRPSDDSHWQGHIYNADNGKTYEGNISLKSPDTLHVSGCVLGGLICGGEDWTRLPDADDGTKTAALCKQLGESQ